MKTFAVYSPMNAELLIRLHDDLVKEGVPSDPCWVPYHLSTNTPGIKCLIVDSIDGMYFLWTLGFADVECELTESNYTSILEEIIQANKPQDADYGQQSF